MIVSVALYLLSLVGATLLVVRGTLFARLRRLAPGLLGCAQCLGFWAGAAAGATFFVTMCGNRWLNAAAVGCLTSVAATATDLVFLKLAGGPAEEK